MIILSDYTGPSIVISYAIAGIATLFAGLNVADLNVADLNANMIF